MTEQWIGFTRRKHAYVCPLNILTDVVESGESITVLAHGLDPHKVADALVEQGVQPQMHYVHARVHRNNPVGRPAKPVQCVQTGEVYASVTEAAKALGMASSGLSNHLRMPERFRSVAGKTFKYYAGV